MASFVVKGELRETRDFGTKTHELEELVGRIQSYGILYVAMESTGVLWRPIFRLLQRAGLEPILVNPAHARMIPMEKTDRKDSYWLARLLLHGFLRPSFVPNEIGQQMRDLTRSRQDYIGRTTEARNQMLKILEGANVKIRSVVSDLNTKTARQIIRALAEGETDVEKLLELCCGSLRNKLKMNEMQLALNHLLSPHDREMLQMLEKDLAHNESQMETLDKKIEELSRKHYQRPVEILTTMPGFSKRNAEKWISEVGGNIDRFESDDQLASYAGLAPGKKQSADVDKPCRRKKGNTYLTTTMVQAAWAAIKVKGSFWQAEFNRLKKRMNSKKAIIAIARKMISVIFAMLKNAAVYQEQGPKRFQKPRVQPSVSPPTTQI